jgi:hypothetical protein
MKNQNKKNEIKTFNKNDSKTFDELFNQDEKEVSREQHFHLTKNAKRVQLMAKINDCSVRISKSEIDYRKSLLDPTMDSVDLFIRIDILKKEMEIAKLIHNQIFPESAI